jgi:DnaJ-class molecular chaperone
MYGTERTDERGAFMARPMPCPTCGGTGELSCCDGPAGHADELPTDPNERSGST